ncbi:wee1-like protein kinase [Bacillus rossius redtenbacheri]|uniref:wee1-like protein kinase n=1 Tax=Bacillus rossius redtenbacheri TaxID=93214 RepID=UPI002FDE088B
MENFATDLEVEDMHCDTEDLELTTSSGCDMTYACDTSSEELSVFRVLPRKLNFLECDEQTSPVKFDKSVIDAQKRGVNNLSSSMSPPYKRVRALKLFDTPTTPKTLFEKCSMDSISADNAKPNASSTEKREKDLPTANKNPFTPKEMLSPLWKKQKIGNRSSTPTGDLPADADPVEDADIPTKKLALKESNISRYRQEFHEICLIGKGEFCSVYKCLNRLDGCTYAVKKSIKPVTGSVDEKRALNEVYAHAVMGRHPNVVCYFSAWAEDDHMFIQNEYCDGGSLADLIKKCTFTEAELRILLLQLAEGLKHIHSKMLVHLDLKPDNVFVSHEKYFDFSKHDLRVDEDDGFEDVEEVTYKIGDLGNVTSLASPRVEEGDCRYLAREILLEDHSLLDRADVFSLGLTVYEAGGGGPLAKNGAEWHAVRDGRLRDLPHCSREFNALLREMVTPEASARPSAAALLAHPVVFPLGPKNKIQLQYELELERSRKAATLRRLLERSAPGSRARPGGKKLLRSRSNVDF